MTTWCDLVDVISMMDVTRKLVDMISMMNVSASMDLVGMTAMMNMASCSVRTLSMNLSETTNDLLLTTEATTETTDERLLLIWCISNNLDLRCLTRKSLLDNLSNVRGEVLNVLYMLMNSLLHDALGFSMGNHDCFNNLMRNLLSILSDLWNILSILSDFIMVLHSRSLLWMLTLDCNIFWVLFNVLFGLLFNMRSPFNFFRRLWLHVFNLCVDNCIMDTLLG